MLKAVVTGRSCAVDICRGGRIGCSLKYVLSKCWMIFRMLSDYAYLWEYCNSLSCIDMYFRLQKIVKDLNRQLQSQGSGPWAANRVASLERSLGELSRMLESKVSPQPHICSRFSICFWSLVTSGCLCINAHEIDRRFQEMKFDPFNVEAKREPSGCTSYILYRAPVVQNLNRFIHRYLSTDMVWVVIYPVDTC